MVGYNTKLSCCVVSATLYEVYHKKGITVLNYSFKGDKTGREEPVTRPPAVPTQRIGCLIECEAAIRSLKEALCQGLSKKGLRN
jgi:hypothetical protein